MSFLFCIGKPVLLKFEFKKTHIRLSVGWFGLWLLFFDLEKFFSEVQTIVNEQREEQ